MLSYEVTGKARHIVPVRIYVDLIRNQVKYSE